jgi:Glyoxalase-like domain
LTEGTVAQPPVLKMFSVVLDAPDAAGLAAFYSRLLGWPVEKEEPDWITLRAPDGGAGLSFQTEPAYVRPVWPAGPGEHAVAAGAVLAGYQPQDDVRVYLDPAGHPFCLFLPD